MEFRCVKCGDSFIRLGAWKRHMSRKHGGYDESDVTQVLTGTGLDVSEENVGSRMAAFARTIPGEGGDAQEEPTGAGTPASAPASEPARPAKTIKATPKRLKKILGSIPRSILESTGIELDDEDKEALDEAGEFLADIFGVEFEVDQQKKVLKSRAWAIVWVGGVALLIYLKHRFSNVWKAVMDKYKEAQTEKAA